MSKPATGKTVRFKLDIGTPLGVTEKTQLDQLRDRDIDFSDLPASPPDAAWARAGLSVPTESKQQVTLRIDRDVLDFFRHTGKRYQTRINQVLRAYMKAHTPHERP
jgi:uncharacterized protein (DUF4415 family)